MNNKFFLFFYFSINSLLVFCQELEFDLFNNSNLNNSYRINNVVKYSLDLPFIDDFSYNSSYPDSSLWKNNNVYVNQCYGVNPITIGVATFDGLNFNGYPYDVNLINIDAQPADTLTSHYIDLSVIDTAYLMFFYQPQGLGNDPQLGDSLLLEFSDGIDSLGNKTWKKMWSHEGSILQDFKKIVIVFSNSNFLVPDFQFRFRNFATISGNYDHWNIDYVKLDEFQSSIDTSNINDVAFVERTPNILTRYTEMPWIHFVNDVSSELNDSIDVFLRNNSNSIQSIDYRYDIYQNNNLVYHYPLLGGVNSTRNVDVPPFYISGLYNFNSPPIMLSDQIFPVNSSDSAKFIFKSSIKSDPFDYKLNDTVSHIQHFYSHFSYDDGSAESSYGINLSGASMAYEFKLNRPDTIRLIQIKFTEMSSNLHDHEFVLTIWDEASGLPGSILYRDTCKIIYKDRGHFVNYYLKKGIGAIGTFFVGIVQMTDDVLNIGFDKNNNSMDYMYYNIGSGWMNSQFAGSWMIRPIVNYSDPIFSGYPNLNNIICDIFPNPFSISTVLKFPQNRDRSIILFDIMGRKIRSWSSNSKIVNLERGVLNEGIYFVQITEGENKVVKKIIVNR